MDDLENYAFSPQGDPMCLYGDPAYPLRTHVQSPFKDVQLTEYMQEFNKSMSSVRVSVEWAFGHVTNSFQALDFKRNLKIGLSMVGKMYVVCVLLRNGITCLYGSQTSEFFYVQPPTLDEYFHLM